MRMTLGENLRVGEPVVLLLTATTSREDEGEGGGDLLAELCVRLVGHMCADGLHARLARVGASEGVGELAGGDRRGRRRGFLAEVCVRQVDDVCADEPAVLSLTTKTSTVKMRARTTKVSTHSFECVRWADSLHPRLARVGDVEGVGRSEGNGGDTEGTEGARVWGWARGGWG